MTSSIENYAMIGDLSTAALVGRDGSIDWLCWPRFDSDACFSALLGTPEHGRWLMAPDNAAAKITRRYRPNTLILETRFETAEGAVTLIDFMPPREGTSHIIRLLVGERGCVACHSELVLRFGYGADMPWVTHLDETALRAIAGPNMVVLRSPVPMRGENFKTVGKFEVAAGETVPFVLSYAPSHEPLPKAVDVQAHLRATEKFWTGWSAKNKISSPWNDAVVRSLITLKALSYHPSGGIVAAPTTSLPEEIGGSGTGIIATAGYETRPSRCYALMNAGYFDEANLARMAVARPGGQPRRRCKSCTASAANGGSPNAPCPGCRDTRIRSPSHRQWRRTADSTRRVRRADGRASPRPQRWPWDRRDRLGGAARVASIHDWRAGGEPDEGIWEVAEGGSISSYSKGYGLVAFDRAIKRCGMPRTSGRSGHVEAQNSPRRGPSRGVRASLRQRAQHVHGPSLETEATRCELAAAPGSSASFRPTIPGSWAPSKRSNAS